MATNFSYDDIGQRYTFEIYPSQIVTTRFTNVEYLGTIDATGVTEYVPAVKHAAVFPYLPNGTVDKYDGYAYHRFRLASGKITFVGDPWIKVNTLVKLQNIKITATFSGVSASDEATIRAMCANYGYTDVTVETINTTT